MNNQKENLLIELDRIREGIKLVGWIVETMNEGLNPREREQEMFELREGVVYFLNLLSKELENIHYLKKE